MTLKKTLKTKILESLRKVDGWKLLVVDPESLLVLDSCCKMSEVLGENVISVEGIFKKRQRQPDKVAVYLISSTLTAVQALVADFGRQPMYRVCHVFCLSPLSDSLFDMIKSSGVKRCIGNLVELNIDFTAPDPGFFCLDIPESYYSVFGTGGESLIDYELQTMAQKLLSVLQNLGEYPHIRYHTKPQAFSTTSKSLSYRLAVMVDSELTRLCRQDPNYPPQSSYDRGILIITDRTIDILSCLIHDVHYQSLLSDLLPFHKQKYTDSDGKEIVLDETDMIYKSVRTWHIGDVTEYVQQRFEQFTSTNETAKFAIGGIRDGEQIEQLKGVIGSFQDYDVTKEALGRHLNICLRISKIYEARGLERVVELEQDLVTVAKNDKNFKRVLKDIDLVLVDPSIEYYDKVRLMFLVVIAQEGISDSDRANLLELVRCDMSEIQALTNLGLLNVRLSPSQDRKGDNNPYGISQISKRNGQREAKFENDKWLPALSFIVEDQINNRLDQNWFPWLKEPPSNLATIERPRVVSDSSSNSGFGSLFKKKEEPVVQPIQPTRKKPSWATRKSSQGHVSESPAAFTPTSPTYDSPAHTVDLRQNGPRVMVFMIGGATFSELRSISDLEQKYSREVLLGSTHTWTPDGFVESLKDLGKRNVQGSKFYGFQRPVDTRLRRSGRDDIPPRPRMPRDGDRNRDRPGSGDRHRERSGSGSSSSSRRDIIPPRPVDRNSGRDRRSPPGSPPRRPPATNRSRQDSLPEDFDRMNVRSGSGRRGESGGSGREEEKKRGWFSRS